MATQTTPRGFGKSNFKFHRRLESATCPDAASVRADRMMRKQLTIVRTTEPLRDAIGRLLRANVSGAPVVDASGAYRGVLSEKCCIHVLSELCQRSPVHGRATTAADVMTRSLVALSSDDEVFTAIDFLLQHRISGAPVVDAAGKFEGIFSEKTAMQVLASALIDGVPATTVGQCMNRDRRRIVVPATPLEQVTQLFLQTPYRRLPVLDPSDRLVGQISRRDLLREQYRVAMEASHGAPSGEPSIQQIEVDAVYDRSALHVTPATGLLDLVHAFLNQPYRRAPVVDGTHVVGQVSRRDLLQACAGSLRPTPPKRGAETLYLSGVGKTRAWR